MICCLRRDRMMLLHSLLIYTPIRRLWLLTMIRMFLASQPMEVEEQSPQSAPNAKIDPSEPPENPMDSAMVKLPPPSRGVKEEPLKPFVDSQPHPVRKQEPIVPLACGIEPDPPPPVDAVPHNGPNVLSSDPVGAKEQGPRFPPKAQIEPRRLPGRPETTAISTSSQPSRGAEKELLEMPLDSRPHIVRESPLSAPSEVEKEPLYDKSVEPPVVPRKMVSLVPADVVVDVPPPSLSAERGSGNRTLITTPLGDQPPDELQGERVPQSSADGTTCTTSSGAAGQSRGRSQPARRYTSLASDKPRAVPDHLNFHTPA
ncbi:hypothetical protein B0H13DRAFT_2676414 [Mycena leptocephala]|nr:hypothetical protein B0H13DRAFT_2676414 [Mycena leptocephala]